MIDWRQILSWQTMKFKPDDRVRIIPDEEGFNGWAVGDTGVITDQKWPYENDITNFVWIVNMDDKQKYCGNNIMEPFSVNLPVTESEMELIYG